MNSVDDVVRALPVFLRNDAQEIINQHIERVFSARAAAIRNAAREIASIARAQIDQTGDTEAELRLREMEQVLENL